jgi:16S rRNA processing protein RimM
VKLRSLSGETAHILSLKTVLLRRGDTTAEYALEGVLASPLAVKFAGVGSPEAARVLRGAELLVPRENAAPLGPAEFYIEDLLGLEVFARFPPEKDNSGLQEEPIGSVANVVEGGGGFLVEILLPSGKKKLVPFRDEFFGPVDPAAGRMELLVRWVLE